MSTKITFIIAVLCFLIVSLAVLKPSIKNVLSDTASSTPTQVVIPTANRLIPSTAVKKPAAVATSAPNPAPTVSNLCIITVDGQKYDVTVFRNQHSGGDVFNCGTDMSVIFHNQHNQRYLTMMAPYKI